MELQYTSLIIHEGEVPTIGLIEDQPIFSDGNLSRLKERLETYLEKKGTPGTFTIADVKQLVAAYPEGLDLTVALPKQVEMLEVHLFPLATKKAILLYKDNASKEAKQRSKEKIKKKAASSQVAMSSTKTSAETADSAVAASPNIPQSIPVVLQSSTATQGDLDVAAEQERVKEQQLFS